MVPSKNIIVGRSSFSEVCAISRAMANSLGSRHRQVRLLKTTPRLDLAYMADDSIGGRQWEVDGDAADQQESFDGSYWGFSEEQSRLFVWTSATSGATIEAKKLGDGKTWEITFTGADVAQAGRESSYAKTFASAAFTDYPQVELPFQAEFEKVVAGS